LIGVIDGDAAPVGNEKAGGIDLDCVFVLELLRVLPILEAYTFPVLVLVGSAITDPSTGLRIEARHQPASPVVGRAFSDSIIRNQSLSASSVIRSWTPFL